MKTKSNTTLILTLAAAATLARAGTPAPMPPPAATEDWLTTAISPVTNPIFFEDPAIRSEVRPIYIHHNIDDGFITGGGDVNVWALQFRYAITDRLALIATKDGHIDIDLDSGGSANGWADVALGLKYALIDDRASQFILTPGFTFEFPLGDEEVFQGNGDGELNLFVSAAKGFGNFHLTGNAGFRIPMDGNDESTLFHFNLMADYKCHRYFHPFVSMSGITVLDEGNAMPLATEGYDLINFGSAFADGETQVVVGGGFRSHLTDSVDFGIAWETAVTSPEGLFDDRVTADIIWRF